jgi:hypothetical protein
MVQMENRSFEDALMMVFLFQFIMIPLPMLDYQWLTGWKYPFAECQAADAGEPSAIWAMSH